MPPRRRGRRALGPHERLNLRLPQPLYDKVCRDALRAGMEVNAFIRARLSEEFPVPKNRQLTPMP